jgi:hypothetical protein
MKNKWAFLVRAHLPIQTYHQKITRKWHQDYRMVINGSLKRISSVLIFQLCRSTRNGHTVVQPVTPVTSPIATPICSGFSF